jgi:hypothetical protein
MKLVKIAVAAALAMFYGNAFAFHSGGVAECEGCHSMHNSFEGGTMVTGSTYGDGSGIYLLKASDQSGACLNCHQSADVVPTGYHISTANVTPFDSTSPVEMTPGGDFAWLKKTMTVTVRGNTSLRDGERYGHSIKAVDYGYDTDTVTTQAPGGSYPSSALGCQACHDPHGRYRRFADGTQATTGLPIWNSGSYTSSKDPIAGVSAVGVYRILGGVGYQPKSLTGSFGFATQAPDVVVASTYNRSEATTQTAVAYGKNMGEWCANCHTAFLENAYTSGAMGLRHPAGNGAKLTQAVADNYNNYVSSGIMTTGAGKFSTLAPFENGSSDYAQLKSWAGAPPAADTSKNVICLSCHRAHASAFESSLRFFYLNEFMTIADASNVAAYDSSTTENKINYGLNVTQQQNGYYGRPATAFGAYSRLYCNKCHAKD